MDSVNVVTITFNQGKMKHQEVSSLQKYMNEMLIKIGETIEFSDIDLISLCLQESNSDEILLFLERYANQFSIIHNEYKQQGNLGKLHLIVFINTKKHGIMKNTDKSTKSKCEVNIDKYNMSNPNNPIIVCSGSVKCDGTVGLMLFTKGGIYCGIILNRLPVILINVHLPSAADKIEDRHACLNKIYEETGTNSIKIIAGDMNYRTDIKNDPTSEDVEKIKQKQSCDIKSELPTDQLKKYLGTQQIFHEPEIKFCQTCRFLEKKKEDQIDYFRSWDPKRYPSWCDRIIHVAPGNYKVENKLYTSFQLTNYSDHNAVVSIDVLSKNVPTVQTGVEVKVPVPVQSSQPPVQSRVENKVKPQSEVEDKVGGGHNDYRYKYLKYKNKYINRYKLL